MTKDEAIEIIKHILWTMPDEPPIECNYVEEWLDEDIRIRKALNIAIQALEYDVKRKKKMPLICIRCKKPIHLSMPTFEEVSYTHYSYCEKCLKDALKTLKLFNEAYKKIYDRHWEILNENESESKKAKLSLSNWVLEVLSVNDEGE